MERDAARSSGSVAVFILAMARDACLNGDAVDSRIALMNFFVKPIRFACLLASASAVTAAALIRWLTWGWKQFNAGGCLHRKAKVAVPPPLPRA